MIIPLAVLLYVVEVAADSFGYDGTLIVQVGFLVFFAMAFFTTAEQAEKGRQEAKPAVGAGRHHREVCFRAVTSHRR